MIFSPYSKEGASQPCYWPDVAVLIVAAAALCLVNWPMIDRVHNEVFDFAANSLLIQDAKSLSLVVGHYSRVGFNHPGPAILYVLALGELLLFDWTHALPSPFSGQMVAAFLFDAVWIALFFRGCRKLSGSISGALTVTALFLFIAACEHAQFFTSIWFPELFFFPYAALLIAAARLASGKYDMLLSLALSAGVLINGHVSFAMTVAIIFLIVMAFNLIFLSGIDVPQLDVRRRSLEALALFSLFFLPLTVETAWHFPGPVASYMSFGQAHQANKIGQAFAFTGKYWGGEGSFGAGLAVMAAIFFASFRLKNTKNANSIRAILTVMIAATFALMVYAIFGVDNINEEYIGYFYDAVVTVHLPPFSRLKREPVSGDGAVRLWLS